MTKNEFLELKNKHSYEKQYKVKDENELKELVKLAEIIDVHMDLNWLDVSNVTNMNNLFYNSKFNGDISKWNVSNVKDMCCMFDNSEFNGNISKWNVSNVTSMAYMLRNSKFNGDISKWNVSNITNMFGMFYNSKFNGDISKWNVSNVTNMNSLFENSKFNGDISKWDVSKVTDMCCMFENSKFNGNISKWNVSKIENANYFNPYLGINNKEDLENYMSFLDSIYNNKPIKTDVKKEWWKTKDLPLYIANRMNRDKEFTDNVKRALCSREH